MARVYRIGFLVDGLLSRYQVRLFDAIRRAARRRDAVVVAFPGSYMGSVDSDQPAFDGSFVYELASPASVDGLIVASNLTLIGTGAARILSVCDPCQVPLVSIGPMPGRTTVDVDNRTGLRSVLEHLVVSHGCRRLAFIRGPLTNPDSLERERVFRTTLSDLGVEVHSELIVTGNFLEWSGAAAVRTLLGERRVPVETIDAIVAANDQMATGAMQELNARGLTIPRDIAVVGFDDDDHARSASPPLTSVAQPVEQLGETSVRVLIDKLDGRRVEELTILPTLPVIRRSCGCGEPTGSGMARWADGMQAPELSRVLMEGVGRCERLDAVPRSAEAVKEVCAYFTAGSEEEARARLAAMERLTLDLASSGVDPACWVDVFTPLLLDLWASGDRTAEQRRTVRRGQNLHRMLSELSAVTSLREQLRTVELANSLRVIGSAVVCSRHFRGLGRVLDAGLPSLDVHYCCICVFTNRDRSQARVATLYNPVVPKPHAQIQSAEQLWRAVPSSLPPAGTPSVADAQSFSTLWLIPPNTSPPSSGDFLVFPLVFGDEALGYVILDAPADARRAWVLEGLSGHLSSAIYEISRTEQLRVAREAAEKASSAKSTFVATMSHEVRTPLNAIMGNLDLCLKTELTKEQRKLLQRAQTSSCTLRGIVDEILDYSRIEARRIELESVPFEFEGICEQVMGSCVVESNRKNLELVLDVHCGVPRRLAGDPLRLTQVLLNLVNNAVKFTPRGFVALRVSRQEGEADGPVCLRFEVEDTGIGMSPEQMVQVFQPFTQADSSVTRRYGGTGLGLTICQQLVELMGGELRLQSEVGRGSVFSFQVQFQPVPELASSSPAVPSRIVLAIENPAQSAALSRLLVGLGHAVHPVSTGQAALQVLSGSATERERPWEFLFADHRLSDMEGRELFSRVQELPENLRPRVTFLVPYDSQALRGLDWEGAEMVTVLAKPPFRSSLERILAEGSGGVAFAGSCNPKRPSSRAGLTGYRILVVQDSEMSLELARDVLTLNGAEVHAATDGAEAVRLARSEPFDLVLMDLHLPVVDGWTAARCIRESHDARSLPIVALSASASPADRVRCLDAGMNEYLLAPIDAGQLVDTVRRWVLRESGAPQSSAPGLTGGVAPGVGKSGDTSLDVAGALGRLGGNRSLYRRLLKRFWRTHGGGLGAVSTLLDEGDYAQAAAMVHVLVSAAGNIGGVGLHHAAQTLEVALRQCQLGRILQLRPRFEAEWNACSEAVREALTWQWEDSLPATVDSGGPLSMEDIGQLRALINEHDTAAVEMLERLRENLIVDTRMQDALQRLAESVSSYDFEAASIRLDSLSEMVERRAPQLSRPPE